MMSKKEICFIAQFPPPMHGLSKAVETLYNSNLNEKFIFEKVNITNNRSIIKSLKLILNSKADLFYFTISQTKSGNLRDLIILVLLHIQRKKCLIHLHGGYYRMLVDYEMSCWQRKVNYKAISKVTGAIVLGPSLKSIFNGMLSDDVVYIVPNCVDDEFLMNDANFKKKISTLNRRNIKHVLYLSNLIRTKGYPRVLEMAKLERESVEAGEERKFHFNFAGKFFEEDEKLFFMNYVKENKLEEYVTYHGIVGGNLKKKLLENCDIFILLTRYANEGQPISILEAMANGMLIVTTDHAGIPDIVRNEINGLVLKKEDKIDKSTLDKIISCLIPDVLIRNRELIKDHYIQRKYINNMKKIFEELT